MNRNGPILEDGHVPSRSCKAEEVATRSTINHQTGRQGLHNNAVNKHNSSNLYRESLQGDMVKLIKLGCERYYH